MSRHALVVRLLLTMAVACVALPPSDAAAANLVANPSFEATGTGWLSPWSFTYRTGAAGTISQSTSPDGSRAAQVDVTQASSSAWLVQLSQAGVPLSSGQTYTVSFAARASAARQIEVALQGTLSPYQTYVARSLSLTTGWATYSFTYAATSTVSDASLRFNFATAAGAVWIDDVAVDSGSPPEAPNLVKNASFEATGTGWLSPWSFMYRTGAAGTIGQSTSPDGSRTAQVDVTQASSSAWLVQLSQAALPLSSGQTYTVSFAAKASAARQVEVALQGTLSPWQTYVARSFSLTTGWATYSFTYAATSTVSDASLRFNLASAAGTVWIDNVAVKSGSSPPPPPPPPPAAGKPKGVSLRPFAEYWGSNLNGMKSDFADMAAAGITWARLNLRYSSSPNPAFDAAVQAAKAQGIQLLAIVWKPAPEYDLGTDAQRATFRAWLAQMVIRHRHHIRHWEIHNEPNLHYEWGIDDTAGSDQTRYADAVRRYVTHLRDGYETVKANDPGATVLFGGVSVWTIDRYLDVLLTTDAYRYFDVMSFHPYARTPDLLVAGFASFQSRLRSNSSYASKPIWVTETGFNTSWTSLVGFVTSEQQKADYLMSAVRQMYALGATLPLFVYTLHENEPAPGFGLTTKDPATLRTTYWPAFYAYRDLVF